MARTVLLTNGRLPKALELARSLHRNGCRVLIAEPFRWHLSRVSKSVARSFVVTAPVENRETYLADLVAVVRRENVDLVVPVSEETMYVAALTDRLPARCRLFAMPQSTLLQLHDKLQFIQVARAAELDAPETYPLGDPRAAMLAAAQDFVMKPVFSCSGRGVSIAKQGDPLPASDAYDPAIVQAFVPGELFSTFSIAYQGVPRITVVYRGAVMSGTVAVCFERVPDHTPIEKWVARFTRHTNYSGFISFDFVVDTDGRAHAIECNPRMTSGAHFVDPDDLGRAVLAPDDPQPMRFHKDLIRQQFYPCLTETQKSVFTGKNFRKNLRFLLNAPDVTWGKGDWKPLLLMPLTSHKILANTILKGLSFGEAATLDISWRPAGIESKI